MSKIDTSGAAFSLRAWDAAAWPETSTVDHGHVVHPYIRNLTYFEAFVQREPPFSLFEGLIVKSKRENQRCMHPLVAACTDGCMNKWLHAQTAAVSMNAVTGVMVAATFFPSWSRRPFFILCPDALRDVCSAVQPLCNMSHRPGAARRGV